MFQSKLTIQSNNDKSSTQNKSGFSRGDNFGFGRGRGRGRNSGVRGRDTYGG